MSINASYLVAVTPRTITGGSADLETNGLVLTKSALLPIGNLCMEFATYKSVASFFGAESDEAFFAQQYFTGVTNQQKAPTALMIARRVDEDAPAWIRSAAIGKTLAELKALSVTFDITVNGTKKSVSDLSLSTATSFSDIASKIATAIGDCTGSYDSMLDAFTFTTTAVGADATIEFATGTDAETLKLTEADGAVTSQGATAMSVSANMTAIENVSRNWTQFTTLWEETEQSEVEAYSAFADTNDDYVYIYWTSDKKTQSALTQKVTIAYALKDKYNCTMSVFAESNLTAAFVLAFPATIKWDTVQGMKVIFGKSASGVPAVVTTEEQALALDDIHVSYVGQFATRNAEFTFANRGHLSSDTYGFYDTLIGLIWFKSCIQRAIMDGFASVNRVPYNQKGYNIVSAWIQDPINSAKNVGVIDTGMSLSNAQKAQILQEIGEDITGDLNTNGYYLEVKDPASNVRAERGSPVMNLYFSYAGSIQKAELPVTAVL